MPVAASLHFSLSNNFLARPKASLGAPALTGPCCDEDCSSRSISTFFLPPLPAPFLPLGLGLSESKSMTPCAWLRGEMVTPPRNTQEARMHTPIWRFRNMEPLFDCSGRRYASGGFPPKNHPPGLAWENFNENQ